MVFHQLLTWLVQQFVYIALPTNILMWLLLWTVTMKGWLPEYCTIDVNLSK